ncbi:hypothetical protein SK3146_05561 [Paenibacillus konkukensis]|uniref:Uncharacterized protein n=1 Tax=Paenibacillus konkukensis TaxID=2020716 RepID=A0ABY4RVK7_9BACL|nr:hypothetical protein SK3146_05561 [Paenibacillus konkukensis]
MGGEADKSGLSPFFCEESVRSRSLAPNVIKGVGMRERKLLQQKYRYTEGGTKTT